MIRGTLTRIIREKWSVANFWSEQIHDGDKTGICFFLPRFQPIWRSIAPAPRYLLPDRAGPALRVKTLHIYFPDQPSPVFQKRWALVTVANVPSDLYESILARSGKNETTSVADPLYTAIADALERKGQLILFQKLNEDVLNDPMELIAALMQLVAENKVP